MDLIVLDIETNIHTGYPVVITVSPPSPDGPVLIRPTDTEDLELLVKRLSGDVLVIGHNIAFDFATLQTHIPLLRDSIWSLYRRGRVSDTMVREKLIRCAQGTLSDKEDGYDHDPLGGYSLHALSVKYLNESIDKSPSSWQKRFHELQDIPTGEWPQQAIDYCINDVDSPRTIWHKQLEQDRRLVLYPPSVVSQYRDEPNPSIPLTHALGPLLNEKEQVRAALSLQLMTQGGIHTDPLAVSKLEVEWSKEVSEGRIKAAKYFPPIKGTATRTMFAPEDVWTPQPTRHLDTLRKDVQAEYSKLGIPVPTTKTGMVKVDEDTLGPCTDPALIALREMTGTNKLLTSFLPVLKRGTVHPAYDILKATGRTSAFDPNVQQLPRKGGVRECFVPRPGYTFIECDYSQIELCALAQAQLYLLGRSTMANAIREGKDLHLVTASVLLNRPYSGIAPLAKRDPKVKEARQLSKAANFGYPGGMGPAKFVQYARVGYGLTLTERQSADLKRAWLRAYPEQRLYFEAINRMVLSGNGDGTFDATQLVSGRIRGRCGFCDGSNTFFQGLAAEGAKLALYLTAYEAYNVPSSPLYGCVGGCFIHDEIIMEAPVHKAPQAAKRLGEIMVLAMTKYIPDVPVKAEPLVMNRLYKDAEPVYDPITKELIPWEPKK